MIEAHYGKCSRCRKYKVVSDKKVCNDCFMKPLKDEVTDAPVKEFRAFRSHWAGKKAAKIIIPIVLLCLSACAPLRKGCMQAVSPPHANCSHEDIYNLSSVEK